ncbi:MAG: hypothetical protein NTY06_01315 [Candidatus Gottesmanbacteria bacterium]|nr:hypothetical protein [Candidatus Gottesmanbacteria bacterium]
MKLIVGVFAIVFSLYLLYGIGQLITAEYLGDYNKASNIVFDYSIQMKVFLGMSIGFFFAGLYAIFAVFYRIWLMVFGKDE